MSSGSISPFLWPCLFLLSFILHSREGNGTPLQYSCLENPWTEEPGRLQSMGSLRVGHDRATSLSLFTFMHWRRKWQPTPVFLPGESQGQRSLMGCCLWGCTESDMTEATQQQHSAFRLYKWYPSNTRRDKSFFLILLKKSPGRNIDLNGPMWPERGQRVVCVCVCVRTCVCVCWKEGGEMRCRKQQRPQALDKVV